MSAPPFTLRLRDITREQTAVAAWVALKCAAWAMYQARLLAAMSEAGGVFPPRKDRLEMVHDAFMQVVEELPRDDPFGDELLRYYEEVGVHLIKDEADQVPMWNN